MSAALRIRPVTDADLPAVRDIYNHYVRTSTVTFDEIPSSLQGWTAKKAGIAAAGIPFLIAETEQGELLGYALGQPWSAKPAFRPTIENSIYLSSSAVGRGVGGALLERFLQECRVAGLREVIAVIADHGAEASLALHRRAGFVDVGMLTGVADKFGRRLGVHLLQRSL